MGLTKLDFRPETEAYTTRIASLILDLLDKGFGDESNIIPPGSSKSPLNPPLRILDLCTGTGCIPLLLHAILSTRVSQLDIVGVDLSSAAITLAKQNLHHNIAIGLLPLAANKQIRFVKGDIFNYKAVVEGDWDVVISNPPYISPQGFNKTTSRSVRNYEPKIALVPSANHAKLSRTHDSAATEDHKIGDSFYPQILKIAAQANAKLILLEVADISQATRVAQQGMMMIMMRIDHARPQKMKCEIWRDWPIDHHEQNQQQLHLQLQNESGESESESESESQSNSKSEIRVLGNKVKIKGAGNGRSVFFSFFFHRSVPLVSN